MNNIKKKIAILNLCMVLALTSACGDNKENTITIGFNYASKITYQKNKDELDTFGQITYYNIDKDYLRVILIERDGIISDPILVGISEFENSDVHNKYKELKYINLENGSTLLHYRWENVNDEEPKIILGENINIVEEISYQDFLIMDNWLQDHYDVQELINHFQNNIKPKYEIRQPGANTFKLENN